jgi:glycine cleavage system H protein
MSDSLELRVDKFIFRVATDRKYNEEGVWAKLEGNLVRVGISDYLQQRSGDVAFVEVRPAGTRVAFDEELMVIETIKVNISLSSPVAGTVIEVNSGMETSPETINQDPYGAGWMAVLEIKDGEIHSERLLDPQAYFARIKLEAEQETKKE